MAQTVLRHSDDLRLSEAFESRLKRILRLMKIAPEIRKEFMKLMKRTQSEPYTFLRSCISTLNLLFMRDCFSDLDFDLEWCHSTSIHGDIKAELAEGFSLLWAHVHRTKGISEVNTGLSDANGICEGRYYNFLIKSAAIRRFTSCEILVESFNYHCDTRNNGEVIVYPESPDIEKGIRFGYIDNDMQRSILREEAEKSGAASLKALGKTLHSAMRQRGMIQFMDPDTFLARVRFVFPIIPQLVRNLESVGYTQEELPEAVAEQRTYGRALDDSKGFAIGDHLTLHDIRMVSRLSMVMATCIATELSQRRHQHAVVANSAVATMSTEALDTLLEIVLSPEAAKEFRSLYSWPPDAPESPPFFDIQYRPLLNAGVEWHVPMFILCSSNLIRSAYVLTHGRPNSDGSYIENLLVEEFIEAGNPAKSNLKIRSGSEVICEIDVAAVIGDTMLILECKDPLLHCNIFELRTTRDHIEKAQSQLDRILGTLADTRQRQAILVDLGVEDSTVTSIVTGIVNTNRLFTGCKSGDHLITSPGNLVNLIRSGSVRILDHVVYMREQGRLSGEAIRRFFSGEFYERIFSAMIPTQEVSDFGEMRLSVTTYVLDLVALLERFGIQISYEDLSELTQQHGSIGQLE